MNTFFIVISLIGAAVVIGLAVALVVWLIRVRRFRPTEDKQKQKDMLNADLEAAGFAYEPRGDYFYSRMYCWQRKTGYCRLYDEGASLFNMIMDCEPVTFSYGGKRWLIELWKGQYGITTGGEIGVYNTHLEDIHTSRFTGTFYENISDAERLPYPLSFAGTRTVIHQAQSPALVADRLQAGGIFPAIRPCYGRENPVPQPGDVRGLCRGVGKHRLPQRGIHRLSHHRHPPLRQAAFAAATGSGRTVENDGTADE